MALFTVPTQIEGREFVYGTGFYNEIVIPDLIEELDANGLKEEVENLSITAAGKVAYSHSIMHTSWTKKDGSSRELMASVTDVYRKIDGKWLIVQEHWSVPVNSAG